MKRIFSVVSLFLFTLNFAFGQTAGDYQSVATGNWNDVATWNVHDGTDWVAATSTPTSSDGIITVRSGDVVTVTADVTIDQTVIEGGGSIRVAESVSMSISNGSNNDLIINSNGVLELLDDNFGSGATVTINGEVINSGSIILTRFLSFLNFESNSFYRHSNSTSDIPYSSWSLSSTCEITGVTNQEIRQFDQNFGNVIWDCENQISNKTLDLSNSNTTILGDFTVANTGTGVIILSQRTGVNSTINGDLIITGNAGLALTGVGNVTLNVGGNYQNTSSGLIRLSGSNGTGVLNISGNLIHNNGTLQGNVSNSRVSFTNATTHDFIGGGSFSNVNVTVGTGSTLNLDASNPFTFRNLTNDGIINASAGNNNISGIFTNNGTFNNNGGTITFTGTASSVSGTIDFYNFSNTGTFTSPATLSVTGNFNNTGTFTAPTTLLVAGDFNNSGTFTQGTNTVEFNGAGIQNVSGTAIFYDINISGTAAVEIEGDVYLQRYLTLGSGTSFDADGSTNNGVLTLLSTSETNSAGILEIPFDASFSGSVTYQRALSKSGEYAFICFPVNGVTIAQIQNSFPVTGPFTGASTGPGLGTNSPSFFEYDENEPGDLNQGWTNFPTIDDQETVSSTRGYISFMRSFEENNSYSVRGPINIGNNTNVDFNIQASGSTPDDGWNLIGNPYPCAIDWDEPGWNLTGMDGVAYVWTGNSYTNTSMGWGGEIAPGQAFWVKASSPGASLSCDEQVKVANDGAEYYRTDGVLRNRLIVKLQDGQNTDVTHICFSEEYTDEFDHEVDAYKLPNDIFNISTSVDNELFLSANFVPFSGCSKNMQMNIDNIQTGNYSLNFSNLEYFEFGVQITLIDHFLDTEFQVSEGSSYQFDVTNDQASYGKERFELIFNQTDIDKPVISIKEDNLISSNVENGNQWYKNGEAIEGEINNTLEINETGIYHLSSSPLGCQVNSDELVAFVSNTDQDFEGCENSILLSSGNIGNGDYTLKLIDLVVDDSIYSKTLVDNYLSSEIAISEDFNYEFAISNDESSYLNRFEVRIENQTQLEITKEGFRLTSNSLSGNQWFKDDVLIEGANEASYQVSESGQYHIEVTNKGCKKSSQKVAVEVEITGFEEEIIPIKIYPNPGTDIVNISVPESLRGESIHLKFYDKLGKLVLSKDFNKANDNFPLEIENLPAGFYTLLIKVQDKTFNHKFVKN